jgi:outer membrane protein with beta-barrel domain
MKDGEETRVMTVYRAGGLAVAAMLCLVATEAGAVPSSRIERNGSIALAGGAGYGIITGDSRFGTEFDTGLGIDILLRYVLGPHWSMGLGFQGQMYDATPEAQTANGEDKLQITDIRFDTYYYRDRSKDASQYVVLGIGLYRPEIHYQASNVSFPGENLELSFGMGAEIFIGETWGLELGGRAIGYFGNGLTTEEEADPDIAPLTDNVALGLRGQAGVFFYILR